ncbi:acyltransferase family protein [Agrobacterium rubi]|uniref:Acyltransferase n=1 Tax=Agrobacterium rubi TaxID=28099 RepID=A0AAE7RAF2_9HYPH|nr:acyltransferase [Agrobacterium rubi]NTE88767.1 acyltransferase [Agrobacterium rubi]NTF04595.1 acyltransferase [Agrobacterium rubi]NTF39157.1 acyltransferase [Agrobacterium rubi]QTG02807.1 acyltransferase [Agrobacterium rubi]
MHSRESLARAGVLPTTVVANQAGPQRSTNRYENIDALRAIAALAVVVQHLFGDILREGTNQQGIAFRVAATSIAHFDAGRFGVVLFFLISGFVVPFSIKGRYPLHRFAISRFFRLFPAMWLALLCLGIASMMHGQMPSLPTVLANMTMVPSLFYQPWMSGAYWTLTIEIIFYVLSASLFTLRVLYRPAVIASFALLLVLATAGPIIFRSAGLALPVQYISLHVSFLYLGLLLRMALVDRLAGAWVGAIFVLLVQTGVLLTIGEFSLSRQDGFFLVGEFPILASYLAALFVFVFSVKTGRPNHPFLSWLGALSYSIYLFHGIAALMVFSLIPLTGTSIDLPIALVILALTLAMSVFVYEYLEKPMINLGYRFIRREDNAESKIAV